MGNEEIFLIGSNLVKFPLSLLYSVQRCKKPSGIRKTKQFNQIEMRLNFYSNGDVSTHAKISSELLNFNNKRLFIKEITILTFL
ncbi:unnamed protein product [Schistosoma rodhaini]|uniref:Uncharacterized protein n=1 Tax=Schistosoma rodhaini TaxID=6188 RepID=A0AA85FIF0_9TREM|nr:unnamed protein product [Schistosoma rodhaini]